jgi:hypothetical protein
VGLLRTAALVVLLAGAFIAEALTLVAGRQNTHYVLTAIFLFWVGSPFAVLFIVDRVSTTWPALMRTTLHWLMLIVTVGTIVVYANRVLHPPNAQGAAVFVAVPPASWLLIAIALGVTFGMTRRSRG